MEGELTTGPVTASPRGRRSPLLAILGLAFLAPGVAVSAWAVQTGYDARRLKVDGVQARAQVRDSQILKISGNRRNQTEYQLRYSFSVPGSDTIYRAGDDIFFFQQDNVWVEVPERTWNKSRSTGTVAIEYLKGKPSVNQPLAARRGYGGAMVFLLAGFAFLAIGFLLTWGGLRQVARAT